MCDADTSCLDPILASGLCSKHYQRARKTGTLPTDKRPTWHRLSNVDDVDRTATCSICGPVKINIKFKKDGRVHRTCIIHHNAVCRARDYRRRIREGRSHALPKGRRRSWTTEELANKKLMKVLTKYGLSLQQYNDLLAKQEEKCAICHATSPLVIDHCHETKAVRGLLCLNCNFALGFMRDNPEIALAAAAYLMGPKIHTSRSRMDKVA